MNPLSLKSIIPLMFQGGSLQNDLFGGLLSRHDRETDIFQGINNPHSHPTSDYVLTRLMFIRLPRPGLVVSHRNSEWIIFRGLFCAPLWPSPPESRDFPYKTQCKSHDLLSTHPWQRFSVCHPNRLSTVMLFERHGPNGLVPSGLFSKV